MSILHLKFFSHLFVPSEAESVFSACCYEVNQLRGEHMYVQVNEHMYQPVSLYVHRSVLG